MIFVYIAGEFDRGVIGIIFLQRFDISSGLRMVSTTDHQFRLRQSLMHDLECFDHQFEPLIGSPFSECQNAVIRIAAAVEIGILRPAGQDAVGAKVYVVAAIFIVQNLTVAGHQDRN